MNPRQDASLKKVNFKIELLEIKNITFYKNVKEMLNNKVEDILEKVNREAVL